MLCAIRQWCRRAGPYVASERGKRRRDDEAGRVGPARPPFGTTWSPFGTAWSSSHGDVSNKPVTRQIKALDRGRLWVRFHYPFIGIEFGEDMYTGGVKLWAVYRPALTKVEALRGVSGITHVDRISAWAFEWNFIEVLVSWGLEIGTVLRHPPRYRPDYSRHCHCRLLPCTVAGHGWHPDGMGL